MIELLVTCLIAAGTTFTVPEGWTAERIGAQGMRSVCDGTRCLSVMVYPIETTYVTLRRTVKPGESVKPPAGCEIEARAK